MHMRSSALAASSVPLEHLQADDQWLNFGFELASVEMSEPEEAGLSSFARDALTVARAMRAVARLAWYGSSRSRRPI